MFLEFYVKNLRDKGVGMIIGSLQICFFIVFSFLFFLFFFFFFLFILLYLW